MNKDEMIKEIEKEQPIAMMIQRYLDNNNIKVSNPLLPMHIEEMLNRKNYCKVADDEIVIKKSEQKQWLKDCIESNKKTEEIVRKQTAREILQEIKQKYGRSCSEYYPEYIEMTDWELNKIAKAYGIELED